VGDAASLALCTSDQLIDRSVHSILVHSPPPWNQLMQLDSISRQIAILSSLDTGVLSRKGVTKATRCSVRERERFRVLFRLMWVMTR